MPERVHGAWALILHGGASEIPDEERDAYLSGCETALAAGREVLERAGSATDAVVAAVRSLESDPTFNAGTGAARNAEGEVQCDAAVMDGTTLDVGAVAAVRGVGHPVEFAASLLRDDEILIVDRGAEDLAARRGLTGSAPAPAAPGRKRTHDTVGCVAVDGEGHFATAVSTGGLDGSRRGRVGDSPLPGGGFFAEDGVGAVVLSGAGEQIARVATASWVMQALSDGQDSVGAAAAGLARLERVQGKGGLIVVDAHGRLGWAHSSPDFAVAWAVAAGDGGSFTRSPEPAGPAAAPAPAPTPASTQQEAAREETT